MITIYVRDLTGNEYACQATITSDYELNGNRELSATILPSKANRSFIDDIAEMWEITDFDDVTHKIVYVKKKGDGKLLSVEIKAIPVFFDTFDTLRIYEEYNEHMTAHRCFSLIFEDSGYSFVLVGQFDAVDWEGLGGGETRLEMFKRALERYKAEFRITGNTIRVEKLIGRDTQFQYRYRLNASNIVQENDASEMWTYAKGYADYEDGGDDGEGGWENANLVREYTSPLADVIGIRHAPPIKDGRIKHSSVLDSQLKTLVDESLKISVSADIHDLRRQGYPLAQPELGDRVFMIDERIGLDEEVRVVDMQITRNWRGEVIDLKLTFGSESITKRYQSNLQTAIKDIQDVMSGNKKIPYSVLDNAVLRATEALRSAQTELVFSDNGILAVDKNDPNLVTLFNSAGLGVSRDGGATFENAITGEGINASVITTGTMLADRIAGGILTSLNGNTHFDLNTGKLDMSQANITLGGGANISFQSSGNGIRYRIGNDSAGIVLSTSAGYSLPFVGVGVSDSTSSGGVNASDSSFRGLRVHSRNTDLNTNLVDSRFTITELTDLSAGGFVFQTQYDGERRRFYPMNTSGRGYDLGTINNRWSDIYADRIMSPGNFIIRNTTAGSGFRFDTTYQDGAEHIYFRGLSTGSYFYALGAPDYRFRYVYLTYEPDVSSDERLKEDITNNALGLSFVNDLSTKLFRMKGNRQEPLQFGIIAQDLESTLENHGINTLDHSIVTKHDDGYYGVQSAQLIFPLINSVQELNLKAENVKDDVEWLKIENRHLRQRIKMLEEKLA